jgi:hypothetical protein
MIRQENRADAFDFPPSSSLLMPSGSVKLGASQDQPNPTQTPLAFRPAIIPKGLNHSAQGCGHEPPWDPHPTLALS